MNDIGKAGVQTVLTGQKGDELCRLVDESKDDDNIATTILGNCACFDIKQKHSVTVLPKISMVANEWDGCTSI